MLRLGCDFCFCCEVAKRPDELAKLGALRHFYVKRPDELTGQEQKLSKFRLFPTTTRQRHRPQGLRQKSLQRWDAFYLRSVGNTTDEVITRPFSISASENTIA